jgi:tetratricopeptide (TPR) repeat protein
VPGQTQAAPPSEVASPAQIREPSEQFHHTLGTLGLLASLGALSANEAESAAALLQSRDVDKLVRSMWARAMAGPSPGHFRLIIGQVLCESGDAKAALTFFNKALEGRQVDPFTTYLVAVALLRMKRYVEVLKIAQGLSRPRIGKMLGNNIEALHLQSNGRVDEAEKKLVEALALIGYPKLHYDETLYNLGRLAENRGDMKTAIGWYEKLAASDPSYRNIALYIESMKARVKG